jgi:hypothetical protein
MLPALPLLGFGVLARMSAVDRLMADLRAG